MPLAKSVICDSPRKYEKDVLGADPLIKLGRLMYASQILAESTNSKAGPFSTKTLKVPVVPPVQPGALTV